MLFSFFNVQLSKNKICLRFVCCLCHLLFKKLCRLSDRCASIYTYTGLNELSRYLSDSSVWIAALSYHIGSFQLYQTPRTIFKYLSFKETLRRIRKRSNWERKLASLGVQHTVWVVALSYWKPNFFLYENPSDHQVRFKKSICLSGWMWWWLKHRNRLRKNKDQ